MSDEKTPEQVLAVPRAAYNKAGEFQGFCADWESYYREFLSPGVAQFIDRELAERSPEFKQIIPFSVFVNEGKILCYRRGSAGGESRLTERHSVGIGGHINPVDLLQTASFDRFSYSAALIREITEEISFNAPIDVTNVDPIGVLNEETTEVGRCHIGFVHLFRIKGEAKAIPMEPSIVEPMFMTAEEILALNNTEGWSKTFVEISHNFL